ncbi:MAG TPA: hypothetical protein VG963_20980, partial [Polyangiaceae bacterium]|nr:hypothetical protein [Polyangiaceae bacterium]
HTTDNGVLDDGWLHFRGRADDIINCGGIKIAPEALEADLQAELRIAGGVAVARTPHPLRGEGVLIAVTPQVSIAPDRLLEAARAALARRGLNAADAIRIAAIEELPCTAAGKVQRHRLSELLASAEPPAAPCISTPTPPERRDSVRAVFAAALSGHIPQASDTFVSLGGDSLSFVQATVGLERILERVPPNWESLSVAELEGLPRARGRSSSVVLETGIAVRALAILSVVNTHIGLGMLGLGLIGSIPGGTEPLMLLSGLGFARFHGSKAVSTASAQPVLNYLSRILPAYWAITLALIFIYGPHHPERFLLLYSSFGSDRLFGFWFIEALVHANIVLIGLLLIPRLRRAYLAAPFAWSMGLTALAYTAAAAWKYDLHGDPRNLVGSLWLFAVGLAIFHAKRLREQLAALCALAFGAITLMYFTDLVWALVSGVAIVLLPRVVLPRALGSVTTLLAKASLYIYLGHMLWANAATSLLHVRAVEFRYLIGVMGGLILYWASEVFWRLVGSLRHSSVLERVHEAAD